MRLLEPQFCIDPECDGETVWDEQQQEYMCMVCDKIVPVDHDEDD